MPPYHRANTRTEFILLYDKNESSVEEALGTSTGLGDIIFILLSLSNYIMEISTYYIKPKV